ncbi:50S ribosomal protein L7/L12 [Patescibacteria group bacterium]|nr:50S ribosomal protein L7/L12 [Patescibacteria group bacterium]
MSDEKKEVSVPEKFKKLVEEVEKMSVLDLSELVKVLEEKFGVSPTPYGVGTPTLPEASVGADEEKGPSLKNVELKAAGEQKIQVIKVIKEVLNLGLKEAKEFVDGAPKMVKEGMKQEEAEELKKKLEEAGAIVEVK